MTASGTPPSEQAMALVRDGRTAFAQGDVERARACFAAAVEIAPGDAVARAGLARCDRLMAESLGAADEQENPTGQVAGDDGITVAEEHDESHSDRQAQLAGLMEMEREQTVVDAQAAQRVEAELARARERAARAREGRGDDADQGDDSTATAAMAAPAALAVAEQHADGSPPGGARAPRLLRHPPSGAPEPHGGPPGPVFRPGPGNGLEHGPDPGAGPAMDSGMGMGPGPGVGPGMGMGTGPGMGPGSGPPMTSGPGMGPGSGPPMTSGPGSGSGPGMGHGPGPGTMGPGSGPMMASGPGMGPPMGMGPGTAMGPGAGPMASGPEPAYPRYVPGVPGNYPQPASTVPGMPMPDGSRQTGPQPALPGAMHPPHGGPPGVAYPQPPGAYPVYGAPGAPGMSAPGMSAMGLNAWIATRTPQSLLGIAGGIAAGCLALGLLIGALASGGDGDEAAGGAAPASGDPVAAAPVRAETTPASAVEAAAPGPATGSIEARVKTVEHPVLAVAVAPLSGNVERVHVKAGGSVTTGQKLYTLRDGRGARASESTVEAPAAGRIERRAARGDSVRKGDVLAQLVDPGMWMLVADMSSEQVGPKWSCVVSTIEGRNRAPCRVEGVQQLGGPHSRVTATAVAEVAGWLQGGGQELVLALAPPASPAGATSPEPVAASEPAGPAPSDDDTEAAAAAPSEPSGPADATASSEPAAPLPAAMAPTGASGAAADAGP